VSEGVIRLGETFGPGLSEREIANVERLLGFELPDCVKALYMEANGGVPDPYVITTEYTDTVVQEFLKLDGDDGDSAIEVLRTLNATSPLPPGFLPFAEDAAGDYFMADCTTDDAQVYLRRHDVADGEERVRPIHLGFNEFWAVLEPDN
jgi:hypothetical protein